MAEQATLARPYAEALFRVARADDMAAWSDLVTELSQIGSHPEVQALQNNPTLTKHQIAFTILSLLKSGNSAKAENLVQVLVENGRIVLLPEIAVQFQQLKNAHEGAADVLIVSAYDLSSEQVKDLALSLEKKFGRKLLPNVQVDPSLIGGFRAEVGDEVLDLSVRAKLQEMQETLIS